MKHLFFLLLLWGCSNPKAPDCSSMLHYAKEHLTQSGVLKDSEGFVYVDLDDDYIDQLLPFIASSGFERPPYFGTVDAVGAHITVIYPDEMKKYGIQEIEESGEKIDFTLNSCQVVHPPKWKGRDEAYFITVDAPELDRLRKKYGLPKREYTFHITIGVKSKAA